MLLDEPCWQYRRVSPDSDETEGRIFNSRRLIPAGEGWYESRGEALAGAPIARTGAKTPDPVKTVAEQVAELERQHAAEVQKEPQGGEDFIPGGERGEALEQAPVPAKRGRKPKAK